MDSNFTCTTNTYMEKLLIEEEIFLVPCGKARKGFVHELARLYQAFVGDSALNFIALQLHGLFHFCSL